MRRNPVVLATSDYYLPGHKGGGAVHALANMVYHLCGNFSFKIVTRDRDFDDIEPYPKAVADDLHELDKAAVFYLSPTRRMLQLILLVRKTDFDVLYLNSFFSPTFTFPLLLLRKLCLIKVRPLVLAPRGEFSLGALKIKQLKKLTYIHFVKMFGLCRDVVWHVSTEHEEADVRRLFGSKAKVFIARDCLPVAENLQTGVSILQKVEGYLDIVFLSRICRKKNLDGALSMLSNLQGEVRMRIYGHKEDADYWLECQKIIHQLPVNVQVEYCGPVAHDAVLAIMAQHHLFFLPTLGENFGYVIFEALIAGCPILISDQTPWRALQEKGVGWEFSLGNPECFHNVLQACINMNQADYSMLSRKAREYGLKTILEDPSVEQSESLFRTVLGQQF